LDWYISPPAAIDDRLYMMLMVIIHDQCYFIVHLGLVET